MSCDERYPRSTASPSGYPSPFKFSSPGDCSPLPRERTPVPQQARKASRFPDSFPGFPGYTCLLTRPTYVPVLLTFYFPQGTG